MSTPLAYLDFDYHEDWAGVGCFEAMASVGPARLAALHAEIALVLAWAHAEFPARGPLEDGNDWDCELLGTLETTAAQTLAYDELAGTLSVLTAPAGAPRHSVTLTLSGNEAFCTAFRQRFGID